MKILFYCQHVLGIGHFFRSMQIAGALDRHRVLFVEGGAPLPAFTPPRHVERAFLPPLMMDAAFKKMEAAGTGGAVERDPEALKAERKELLARYFEEFQPDLLMIELFPFGRKAFGFELLPILQRIRDDGLPVKVVCSLRDILVEKEDQAAYEERVLKWLNTYFDLLLIHSDPRFISLEETFERTAGIRIPVHYTGFVVRRAPKRRRTDADRVIVASSGGGKVGADLLACTVKALRRLPEPDIRLQVFLGPFMEGEDRDRLAELAAGDSRIELKPFSFDFLQDLVDADLSISMAGYNTCMDILSAGVRALVYPFPQNREQMLRAKKLSALGALDVLSTLDEEPLATAIGRTLKAPAPASRPRDLPDLGGARNTAFAVENYFTAL